MEGLSLPRFGKQIECKIEVENDVKPTVLTMIDKELNVKQTEKQVDLKIMRLGPNIAGAVKIGWHTVDTDPAQHLDYFYGRQRGTVKLSDGQIEGKIEFKDWVNFLIRL